MCHCSRMHCFVSVTVLCASCHAKKEAACVAGTGSSLASDSVRLHAVFMSLLTYNASACLCLCPSKHVYTTKPAIIVCLVQLPSQ